MVYPIGLCYSRMTLLCWCISPNMVYLCIINDCVFKIEVEMMQKCSFSPKIPSKKIVFNPYSFVLAKTAPRSDVVCRCLTKSSDTGVVANTKGEEMMTSCCRTASFASCACCSALSLHQALIP